MTVARDLVRIKLLLLWKPKDNDKINQYLPSIHSDHRYTGSVVTIYELYV